jgi:hypothetical protein
MVVVGLLGQTETQRSGINRYLGDESVADVLGLDCLASQSLGFAH